MLWSFSSRSEPALKLAPLECSVNYNYEALSTSRLATLDQRFLSRYPKAKIISDLQPRFDLKRTYELLRWTDKVFTPEIKKSIQCGENYESICNTILDSISNDLAAYVVNSLDSLTMDPSSWGTVKFLKRWYSEFIFRSHEVKVDFTEVFCFHLCDIFGSVWYFNQVISDTKYSRYVASRMASYHAMLHAFIRRKLHLQYSLNTLSAVALITSLPYNPNWKTAPIEVLSGELYSAEKDKVITLQRYNIHYTDIAWHHQSQQLPAGFRIQCADFFPVGVSSSIGSTGLFSIPRTADECYPSAIDFLVAASYNKAQIRAGRQLLEKETEVTPTVSYSMVDNGSPVAFDTGYLLISIDVIPFYKEIPTKFFPECIPVIKVQNSFYVPFLPGFSGKDTMLHFLFPSTKRAASLLRKIYKIPEPDALFVPAPVLAGLTDVGSQSYPETIKTMLPQLFYVGLTDLGAYSMGASEERPMNDIPLDELFHDFIYTDLYELRYAPYEEDTHNA